MKNLTKTIGFIIAFAATSAQAIPTLIFDIGNIDYTAATQVIPEGQLNVDATLTNTVDVGSPSVFGSASVIFDAFFTDYLSVETCGLFSCNTNIIGNFEGSSSPSTNDLTVVDADGIKLLTAKFQNLSLEGGLNSSSGTINGTLLATGGTLSDSFIDSDLFTITLELNNTFSDVMFKSDFSGNNVRGTITGEFSVPEPSILGLIGLGLLITGFSSRKSNNV